jgi:hypothetical protein
VRSRDRRANRRLGCRRIVVAGDAAWSLPPVGQREVVLEDVLGRERGELPLHGDDGRTSLVERSVTDTPLMPLKMILTPLPS